MHELSIAQNIFDIIMRNIDEGRVTGKIISISLRVGKMTTVIPENLRFMFEVLTSDTPLKHTKLEIEHIPIQGKCNHCGLEFQIESIGFQCPQCNSDDVQITSGRELEIESVEVE